MKIRGQGWNLLAVAALLAGCATDSEVTQKEKDKMARDAEKQNQKQAQAEAKMMREATGQRKSPR